MSKSFFPREKLIEIREKFSAVQDRVDEIVLSVLAYPFQSELAREYAQHGFARRVGTLGRCIHNTFRTIPLGTVKIPSREKLYDGQIQIQSFIANLFGSVDNLAWVYVHECGLSKSIPRGNVGLRKSNIKVRASLSSEFQTRLDEMEQWFGYVTEYRDALAHRIPLYIPPGVVPAENVDTYNEIMVQMNDALNNMKPYEYDRLSVEQSKLLVFQPVITHSVRETTGYFPFHAQMIADFLTVEDLWMRMRSELKAPFK